MEKITASQFGKFEGFELINSKNIMGGIISDDEGPGEGDKIIATGAGSGVHKMEWCVWEGDSYYQFSNGTKGPTSYGYTSKSPLLA